MSNQVIEQLRHCMDPMKRQTPEHWMTSMQAAIDEIERLREPQWLLDLVKGLGPLMSECREKFGEEGGWVKVRCPNAKSVMNIHALLAGRFDLIDPPPSDVKPYDHGPGTLEVGLSKDLRDVVVNHPCLPLDPRGGHLVFSPKQARDFASLLMLKAEQAEGGKA